MWSAGHGIADYICQSPDNQLRPQKRRRRMERLAAHIATTTSKACGHCTTDLIFEQTALHNLENSDARLSHVEVAGHRRMQLGDRCGGYQHNACGSDFSNEGNACHADDVLAGSDVKATSALRATASEVAPRAAHFGVPADPCSWRHRSADEGGQAEDSSRDCSTRA